MKIALVGLAALALAGCTEREWTNAAIAMGGTFPVSYPSAVYRNSPPPPMTLHLDHPTFTAWQPRPPPAAPPWCANWGNPYCR